MSAIRLTSALSPLTAVAAVLLTVVPVAAQPKIPPDARGAQATMIIQQYHQSRAQQAAPRPASPTPPARPAWGTSVGVTVSVPDVSVPVSAPTTYVSIQGPDGKVRRFPLARGVEVQYARRHVVLRPGESTTVRLTPVP